MNIVINKLPVDGIWGGGNQILKLLSKYFEEVGNSVSYHLEEGADVVLAMDVRDHACSFSFQELMRFKEKHNVPIIHRVNDNGSHRKNDSLRDDLTIKCNRMSDRTIFISEWLRAYFKGIGMDVDGSFVVHNGVDRDLFRPCMMIKEEKSPLKIVSHHWSNNMSKGYDVYNALDSFCHQNPNMCNFRFFGQCPSGYLNTCEKFSPQPYVEVPKLLYDRDIYITATRFESGGCHIVEGMACGLIPMVYVDSGGPVNYAEGFSVIYGSTESMLDSIVDLYNDYERFVDLKKNIINNYTYDYRDMGRLYMDVIKEAVSGV